MDHSIYIGGVEGIDAVADGLRDVLQLPLERDEDDDDGVSFGWSDHDADCGLLLMDSRSHPAYPVSLSVEAWAPIEDERARRAKERAFADELYRALEASRCWNLLFEDDRGQTIARSQAATPPPPKTDPISITEFDPVGPVVITPGPEIHVHFECMPPSWAQPREFEDLDLGMEKAIGARVVQDDREHFIVPAPLDDTLARLVDFLRHYRDDH